MKVVVAALKKFAGRALKKAVENKVNAVVATVGAGTAGVGVAAILKPEILELIPENVRGYAVLAVVLAICAKSIAAEFGEAIREARKE